MIFDSKTPLMKTLFPFLFVVALFLGAPSGARADLVVETKAQSHQTETSVGETLIYALSATVRDTDAISATPILDPHWEWSVEKVEFQSEEGAPWIEKTGDCVLRFEQNDMARPDAREHLTFALSGSWRVQLRATLFYRTVVGGPIHKVSGVGSGI